MGDVANLPEIPGEATRLLNRVLEGPSPGLQLRERGAVTYVSHGVARVKGLPGAASEELLRFPDNLMGMAFNLDPEEVGVILLDDSERLKAGDEVRRTGRVLDVPVGDALLGRVLDALGRPVDSVGPVRTTERWALERPAPPIMDRAPVTVPLQTGITVADALIPIGRGQRELILGDRQTGKTAIAVDAMINQYATGVLAIYCAIGQRASAVAGVIADLRKHNVLGRAIVVVASGDAAPGLQYIAPYAAMTMAEYFMRQGRDVLLVLDDLTHHARAYRELSLLLRRPPGREGYPGDIFYIHSRLLERSTHLREDLGGGSITALPIIETQQQNLAAYIPTNLISITDGQIYLSPVLFQKGVLPAVDVGKSVSRVGGKTQLKAYRRVAGDLRLAYSQFEELEVFARFGTRLDEHTRQVLNRGRRVREVLKQKQYAPISVPEQIAVLVAVNAGVLDDVPAHLVEAKARAIRTALNETLPGICASIGDGQTPTDEELSQMVEMARAAVRE